ncbi:hypothetical protein RSK20926_06847 [Roseobacter sp. SK209-2-6]|uniref:sugar nucleotide-binding protein n=1 Tax=Roseobacter sp. SK209-2-6 TaxID=388739 RepID=UPI0000F3D8A3|nr:sugar nucleotide-binding protein [Roseobacter sp. SK209-2-6]EBA17434.1 hypothetical protein RSK20926_06847 [Roseobacter sp. SK209-2-6]
MSGTALILGASGRFGRTVEKALKQAGWNTRRFQRGKDDLMRSAVGVDLIVNGWNPLYPDWAAQVPGLHRRVIEAAEKQGATVILPGNVYVFGAQTPAPWSEHSPHEAQNPLGRIRIEMEEAYRASSAQVILVRAGDFLDTEPSGNWFEEILVKSLAKGKFTYPGNPEIPHAWAYLPDLARAIVMLAEIRTELPRFLDLPFPGYTLSGQEMLQALNKRLKNPAHLKEMSWLPLHLTRPFWPLGRCLLEMRYLWDTPHWLDGSHLQEILPGFQLTSPVEALARCVPSHLLSAPATGAQTNQRGGSAQQVA